MEEDLMPTREYWERNRPVCKGDIDDLNRRIDELYAIIDTLRNKDDNN